MRCVIGSSPFLPPSSPPPTHLLLPSCEPCPRRPPTHCPRSCTLGRNGRGTVWVELGWAGGEGNGLDTFYVSSPFLFLCLGGWPDTGWRHCCNEEEESILAFFLSYPLFKGKYSIFSFSVSSEAMRQNACKLTRDRILSFLVYLPNSHRKTGSCQPPPSQPRILILSFSILFNLLLFLLLRLG